jgi:hypothetical protein
MGDWADRIGFYMVNGTCRGLPILSGMVPHPATLWSLRCITHAVVVSAEFIYYVL